MLIFNLLSFGFILAIIASADADICKIPRITSRPQVLDTENNKILTENTPVPTTTILPDKITSKAATAAASSTASTPTLTELSSTQQVPTTEAKLSTLVPTPPPSDIELSLSSLSLTNETLFNLTNSEVSELIAEALTSGGDYDTKACPGPDDPVNNTMCCSSVIGDTVIISCCSPDVTWLDKYLFFVNDELAMMIAISVTAGFFLLTVIIIICCCWSRCPLYTTCRIKYRQDDIIAYATKDEETAGLNDMPPEEKKGVTVYSPNAVKVTLKETLKEDV